MLLIKTLRHLKLDYLFFSSTVIGLLFIFLKVIGLVLNYVKMGEKTKKQEFHKNIPNVSLTRNIYIEAQS